MSDLLAGLIAGLYIGWFCCAIFENWRRQP